jgi:uncharacterized protein YtpQ (UPF0354 family)
LDFFKRVFPKRFGRNEYAAMVSKALSEAGVAQVRYDEEEFSIHRADGGTVFLENGHARFCAAEKRDRQSVLMEFVSGCLSFEPVPESFARARASLMPIVRSASYVSLSNLQSQSVGERRLGLEIATQTLSADLVAGLAYDTDQSLSLINHSNLEKWGTGFDEALSAARENLRDRTDPSRMVQHAPGLFVGQWDDSYESSRMLLTDLIYRLPLDGDPVVSIPSRNQFWVTGSKNSAGIDLMAQFCKGEHLGAYPLSPYLFLLCGGHWTKFRPETKTLTEMLNSIERNRMVLDYGQQKGYLESINVRDNIDIFVASYMAYTENETGREYSTCVWSNGVDSLLPQTDEIILLIDSETKERIKATWDVAQLVVGHRMEKQSDLFPERYRVRSFPSSDEISELRRRIST